ncbi:nucleotidyltransferase family protein [Ideonella livida]|uniref:NTP transferase domain-containing protein n=1 Tax=Ideonella livida TaxID=2707176 RepID=A0A7C9PFX0_9BURK|nr:NTP transferase domain-containing protein [Ideonella livida]NDY90074.1 NTP transferase domain-containing protein [Ideonella livida]
MRHPFPSSNPITAMPLPAVQTSRPAVLVVGAGRNSRGQGAAGVVAEMREGEPVLVHTIRRALASGLPVVVVTTGAFAVAVGKLVATRDVVVLGPAGSPAQADLGEAVAAGVSARTGAAGWLVLPGDMPRVQPDTLRRVAAELARHPVAYAQFRGRRGHPIGFGAELFSDLVRLRGDDGARRLVARYPAQAVDVDDPGVLPNPESEENLPGWRRARADRVLAPPRGASEVPAAK